MKTKYLRMVSVLFLLTGCTIVDGNITTTYIYKNDSSYDIAIHVNQETSDNHPWKGEKIFALAAGEEQSFEFSDVGPRKSWGFFQPFPDYPHMNSMVVSINDAVWEVVFDKQDVENKNNPLVTSGYETVSRDHSVSVFRYVFTDDRVADIVKDTEANHTSVFTYRNETAQDITLWIVDEPGEGIIYDYKHLIAPGEEVSDTLTLRGKAPAPFCYKENHEYSENTYLGIWLGDMNPGLAPPEPDVRQPYAAPEGTLFDTSVYTLTKRKDEFRAAYLFTFTDNFFETAAAK
ncbi:MAG TPA: hypothetical protein H9866_04765 [Candidatus Tidjanibacter gallistercoris]|nr:hypothetical protein [Candidatus Tidjanibacter gallistercoris]